MKTRLAFLLLLMALAAQARLSAAWAQSGSNDALTRIDRAQRDESLRRQTAAAEQAVQRQDWPAALAAWQSLALERVDTAPAQLCKLTFDGRGGRFEAEKAIDWCRRAAGAGDADALYRMGLLYLVGLGQPRNIQQAHAFCAAALLRDTSVPAKFCLAAVALEQARADRARLADLRTQNLPVRGGDAGRADSLAAPAGASAAALCSRAFIATDGPFDAAAVAASCGAAAAHGDPQALSRMGLMHLVGLADAPDLGTAQRDCVSADQQSRGKVSAAFCLAAIAETRRATDAAGQGPGLASALTTGRPLPATLPDPFVTDRILDEAHRTASGLDYTCRKMADWARFEAPDLEILTPRDRLFGKVILDFRPQDFSDLDRAAQTCTAATAGAEPGRLAQDLSRFRLSLASLKSRQDGLRGLSRQAGAEASQIARDQQFLTRVQQTMAGQVSIDAALPTPQEAACVEQVRRVFTGSLLGEQTTLDIRNSSRTESGANYLVRGEARVNATAGGWQQSRDFAPYSCIFVGHTEKIADSSVAPPALAGAGDAAPAPSLRSSASLP